MARTVVGLFDRFGDAQETVRELVEAGFERGNVSLVANDAEGRHARVLGLDQTPDEDRNITAETEMGDSDTTEGAKSGAGIGAGLGGIAGFLVGMGAFLIPGIGPILGAGPLIAALGGAAAGAVAGGIIGGLTKSGISEEDAVRYEEGIRRGGVLVLVYTDDTNAELAVNVLNRHNPVDIEERERSWRQSGWGGSGTSGEAFVPGQERQHERQAVSRLDFGPGARSYLQGQPVANYDRSVADLGNYTEFTLDVNEDEWRMYESRFREDFDNRFRTAGGRWEDFRDIYRYGYAAGHHPHYSNARWEDIRGDIRQDYQVRYPDNNWEAHEEMIRHAWEIGRVPR